ncbi:hypothetical protein CAPTEDRAFT_139464 [Capitella teleta]|uniref:Vasohibin-1 n=1 Tax=Capitella teleta TaxID=283909 RepID=R7TKS7_CAPTE|nr:hypothetical protein CAPTEDRAFT_139464 [Capitella teleta]|eukprot:ELT94112.1 hypothetical protein CAPTEDRAFT_139464 [Capitella teleta]
MSRTEEADYEEEEENDDGGVWFYVNQSGFPMDSFTYDRMWNHVSKLHPEGYRMAPDIQDAKDLPEMPVPQAPLNLSPSLTVAEKLSIVQKYMSDLQYNHTGTQFYEIRKHRPISGLMDVAKDMIRESLPIKCLEAVILGIYLTNGIPGLDRFPVSFRTVFNRNIYNHVVLGVYYNGLYGSIGMSRRSDLMDKPLVFKSLSGLVSDFKASYNNYWHETKKVAIGVPVPHDPHSYEQIEWRGFNIHTNKHSWTEICRELDKHAREIRVQVRGVFIGFNHWAGKHYYVTQPGRGSFCDHTIAG